MKVGIVLGTRPEIIKFYSIVKELQKNKIDFKVWHTNQHFSDNMSKDIFNELMIPISYKFNEKYSPEEIIPWLKECITDFNPDVVLVQGDTSSAFYGAVAALECKIKIGHIEAGLRSNNILDPYPEEPYRCAIDGMSTYLFCPTSKNLMNTSNFMNRNRIIVGNTVIDVVKEKINRNSKTNTILVTCHRRENWNKISILCDILRKLSNIRPEKIEFIMHANKDLQKQIINNLKDTNIKLIQPMSYIRFISKLSKAKLIISDSGGIVEEASFLKTHVAIIRNFTERPEAIESGCATLVGLDRKETLNRILETFYPREINDCPYGNGKSGEKIIKYLISEIDGYISDTTKSL